jgi:hypothetical protein
MPCPHSRVSVLNGEPVLRTAALRQHYADGHKESGHLNLSEAQMEVIHENPFVSWTRAVRGRSAVTGSRKESVKISAAGHAKSGDFSSIVDPKGGEQIQR